ncbi:MAG: aminotransferase class I/II-fold pyridoxal phosphate-dependent enzyme, partial [cyanobacterium endosymbiont of Rhopalodia fuxianensis]
DSNFVFASSQWIPASELYKKLKERKVLIRYFKNPRIEDYVRISVGTDQEIAQLLEAINKIKSSL